VCAAIPFFRPSNADCFGFSKIFSPLSGNLTNASKSISSSTSGTGAGEDRAAIGLRLTYGVNVRPDFLLILSKTSSYVFFELDRANRRV
jgi:hypothetical protein